MAAVLPERSIKAMRQARDTVGLITPEQMAKNFGVSLEEVTDDEEDEPHWSELPPSPEESGSTRVARLLWRFGFKALFVADYVGGGLAWALGISSSKYQDVLDELESLQDEEREEEELELAELQSLKDKDDNAALEEEEAI